MRHIHDIHEQRVREETAKNAEGSRTAGPIGGDGYWTLLLSNLIIAGSAGLYWLWLIRHVYLTAKCASPVSKSCDYITVLGMRLVQDQAQASYIERLQRARQLFKDNVADKILIIGGVTGANTLSEAQGGKDFLVQQGVAAESILLEDRSRHTLENLHNVRAQYLGRDNKSIALITNRFHLARSQMMATGMGIRHQLCAAEDRPPRFWQALPRIMLEAYYIHWYQVGKLWSYSVRSEKSLSRIR